MIPTMRHSGKGKTTGPSRTRAARVREGGEGVERRGTALWDSNAGHVSLHSREGALV